MKSSFRSAAVMAASATLLCACSNLTVPSAPTPSSALNAFGSAQTLYAYSPRKALLAAYAADAEGARPIAILAGNKTRLATSNGIAVDADGTIYVVTYQYGFSHGLVTLLVFPPNAHGNVAPERSAVLPELLAGYSPGLALDGHGNFWIDDIHNLLRFPTSASGSAKPNGAITLQLQTSYGLMPANSSNVALDSAGNVYCICVVVYHGYQWKGVSEYSLTGKKAKLIRSFYDPLLPEVPPSTIAIDRSGNIYMASTLPNTGIFEYDANTKSGSVHYSRRFTSGQGTSYVSVTTDASGYVYAAALSSVMVYGPHANGHVRPLRSIHDPAHLDYMDGDFGTLLNVH
jgi:sugar lactone lactonase YvrE